MLVLLAVLIGLIVSVLLRAKRAARVVKDGAALKQKLDDALLRRAIRDYPEYDHYRRQLERQMKSAYELEPP